jgi:hypothetical protein
MAAALRFCLVGEDGRVFLDELVEHGEDFASIGARYRELADELAGRGVATRLIASDPDGDVPTVVIEVASRR